MAADLPKLVTSDAVVEEIASNIRAAGMFCMDLEFASDGRYVPELCLLQVAWPGEPMGVALLDAQQVQLEPIFALLGSPGIDVVAHAARQDIALLSTRYDVSVSSFWDTQIGAAFAGIGEQIGYGKLVEELLGRKIDKGPQFTDWTARPLSDRQLRYAAADVTHLLTLWPILEKRLLERDRLDWVAEETAAMVVGVAERVPPEEKYRTIGRGGALRGKHAAVLVALAAWREREALTSNKPPSWILSDAALLEACRRLPTTDGELRRIKGVGTGTIRQYSESILAVVERGVKQAPPPATSRGSTLPADLQPLAALLNVFVASRCVNETLPPKLIGSKMETEELVHWHAAKKRNASLPRMLSGWRRAFIGDDAIRLLSGDAALAVDDGAIVLRQSSRGDVPT